jgi:drug/metabolite transporter (DMT)-like permease
LGFGVPRFKKLATARSEAMTDPKSCGHFERTANGERQTGRYVFLLLFTAFFWSLGGVLIKSIDWNPVAIAGSRSLIAIFLIAILRPSVLRRFSWTAVFGGMAYTITVVLFVVATKLTTAANAIFLQYTAPIYIALLSPWLLRERVSRFDWILIGVAFGGIALFFCDGLSLAGTWGVIAALTSGVSYAWLTMLMRREKSASPEAAVFLGNLMTVLVAAPAMWPPVNLGHNWPWLLALGVLQLTIPYLLYARAIRHVRALDASIVSMIEPILNPIWVMFAVGERPAQWAIIGGCIVLGTSLLRSILASCESESALISPAPEAVQEE